MSFKKIRICYSNLLKSTNSHPENMQHHTNSISFRLFLNLKISGMPDLKELIFWIYTNNTKYNNYDETILLFKLFKGPSIKYVSKTFRKTNISHPLVRTRTCAYQGVRSISFWEILRTYLIDDS